MIRRAAVFFFFFFFSYRYVRRTANSTGIHVPNIQYYGNLLYRTCSIVTYASLQYQYAQGLGQKKKKKKSKKNRALRSMSITPDIRVTFFFFRKIFFRVHHEQAIVSTYETFDCVCFRFYGRRDFRLKLFCELFFLDIRMGDAKNVKILFTQHFRRL